MTHTSLRPADEAPVVAPEPEAAPRTSYRIRVLNCLPYLSIHALCLGVIWVGWSWTAVGVAAALYLGRMFVITGFYHRYFSHRTFKMHRATQAVFAFLGTTTAQRGPIWWASHHRDHHRHSDQEPDIHSPVIHKLLWSHMGWFLSDAGLSMNKKAVPDLLKVPELRWIDRFHMAGPLALAAGAFLLGWGLQAWAPGLGTNGPQMFVWAFAISTALLYHGTFTINSLAHMFGSRRFRTKDDSRNNFLLALITLGEGWHNNHHHYPGTARQGFYWWEFDPTYYGLWVLEKLGIVWELRRVPAHVYAAAGKH